MAMSGPYLPVIAPSMPAPLIGLPASASPVTRAGEERWLAGFTYTPEACFAGEVLDVCPPAPVNKNVEQHGDPRLVRPVALKASDRCSTFGLDLAEYQARAERLLNRSEAKLQEGEFWVGSIGGWSATAQGSTEYPFEITLSSNHVTPGYNPTLASPGAFILNGGIGSSLGATLVATQALIDVNIPAATAITATAGLAMLEAALADCGSGAPGFIHASRDVVTTWNNENLLLQRGDQIVTILGNIVVPGAGYPGTAPPVTADLAQGYTLPPAGEAWVYATSAVSYRKDAQIVIGVPDVPTRGVDRQNNDVTTYAERMCATYFDECCHLAVLLDAC